MNHRCRLLLLIATATACNPTAPSPATSGGTASSSAGGGQAGSNGGGGAVGSDRTGGGGMGGSAVASSSAGGAGETSCDGLYRCISDATLCLDDDQVCDGEGDCPNGEDETWCATSPGCAWDEFRCPDGACIDRIAVCDGAPDCGGPDPADEDYCDGCDEGAWFCPISVQCIHQGNVCNGINPNGTGQCLQFADDEKLCDPSCEPGQYRCWDGSCIESAAVCNGVAECGDGDDEPFSWCG